MTEPTNTSDLASPAASPDDYVMPEMVVEAMRAAGTKKAKLAVGDLLLRGVMSGAILGFATAVALQIVSEGSPAWTGALLFPIGFCILVLLGFELVTGNFALLPAALLDGRIGLASSCATGAGCSSETSSGAWCSPGCSGLR